MSIERFRDRLRSAGRAARGPHPDGISRRVALAARDRQSGPPPEQVLTGWHRHTFGNPTRSGPPAIDRSAESAAPEPGDGRRRIERPRHQVGRVLDPHSGRGRKPVLVLTGVVVFVSAAGAVVTLVVAAGSGSPVPTGTVRPNPAVVSTITPGDPGFGWPSSTFGPRSREVPAQSP